MKATAHPVTMAAVFTFDLYSILGAVTAEILAIRFAAQADAFDRLAHEVLAPAYYIPTE